MKDFKLRVTVAGVSVEAMFEDKDLIGGWPNPETLKVNVEGLRDALHAVVGKEHSIVEKVVSSPEKVAYNKPAPQVRCKYNERKSNGGGYTDNCDAPVDDETRAYCIEQFEKEQLMLEAHANDPVKPRTYFTFPATAKNNWKAGPKIYCKAHLDRVEQVRAKDLKLN